MNYLGAGNFTNTLLQSLSYDQNGNLTGNFDIANFLASYIDPGSQLIFRSVRAGYQLLQNKYSTNYEEDALYFANLLFHQMRTSSGQKRVDAAHLFRNGLGITTLENNLANRNIFQADPEVSLKPRDPHLTETVNSETLEVDPQLNKIRQAFAHFENQVSGIYSDAVDFIYHLPERVKELSMIADLKELFNANNREINNAIALSRKKFSALT